MTPRPGAAGAADRIAWSAATLLRSVTEPDYPRGVAVLNRSMPGRLGTALGIGHELAAAAGLPADLRPAVLMDATAILERCDWHEATAEAVACAIACHEAAHLLVAVDDATPDVAAALLAEVGGEWSPRSATVVATGHCPRWAGAYAVLALRARHVLEHNATALFAAADVRNYGYELDAVLALCGWVDAAAELRPLLLPGETLARSLTAASPAIETRAAVVAAWHGGTEGRGAA